MGNIWKTLKKGGYSGDQTETIRFRVSAGLHDKIRELARQRGLCTAAVVRKLVISGLESYGSPAMRPR